jgi:TonB-linked SusC/RagA family outer membrane protein
MKKFTNYLFLIITVLLVPSLAFAQRTITGVVTDAETGEALIAANVIIAGTTTGSTTDIEGKYSILLPKDATKLVFSYTGYTKQEITVGASNVLNIRLRAGEELGEIVVIGYGEIKKEDATGAIASVSSKDFNTGPITSAQDLIAGKMAGVSITPSSDPGGGAGITIRGLSSLRASNNPLVVIDGVPIDQNNTGGGRNFLNLVNPNDIENISVLKDASAAAIYGSRAAGGVILITTKKGHSSKKFQLNYNGNVSMNQVTRQIDVLNAAEYRTLIEERDAANGTNNAALLGDANTDWQSEIYQNGLGTDHNVNFSGGVKGFPYRASVGYTNKDGVLKTENFQRTTLSLNVNPKFLDNTLQVNFSSKAMFTQNRFADRGAVGSAVGFNPTMPVLADDQVSQDLYGGYFTYINPTNNGPLSLAPTNPVAMLNLKDDRFNVQRYLINGSIDYRMPFLPELRANLSLGIDQFKSNGTVLVDSTLAYASVNKGSLTEAEIENRNEVLEFYLNYAKEFSFGNIDVMGGYSWQHFYFNDTSYSRNLTETQVFYEDANPREYYLLSLFGRINYSYKDLLLTFTLRRDGSSRFSETARWGLFPSAAAAYKIIKNKEGFVNDLKVRASFGTTGQQDIGNGFGELYPYLPLYDSGFPTAQYQFGNQFYTTQRPRGYDLNIRWETTTTYNAGIDFSLLKDKLTGSLDVYQRLTSDLINEIEVPAGSNFTNRIVTNIGTLRGNGVELALNATPIRKGNFTWSIGGNATYEKNEITKLIANANDTTYLGIFTGGISGIGNTIQIHSVGQPIGTFFAYQQVYDENGQPIEGEYEDIDGDGTSGGGNGDRVHSTNPNANWFFGINTRFTYENWELSLSGRAKLGNYIYNNVLAEQTNYNRLKGNTAFLTNVHSDINEIGFETPQLLSDFYIRNGSFFRLDFVTVSYVFPKIGSISDLRIFGTVQNALTITNYGGLDPEVGGIDGSVYPRSRAFLLGVSAGL